MCKNIYEEILRKSKNFNEVQFNKMVRRYAGSYNNAYWNYRRELLKISEEEDFSNTKENLERLFLESLNDNEYKLIINYMNKNNWTTKEAYIKARETGEIILLIVKFQNEKKVA